MSKFSHDAANYDDADARAMTTPQRFLQKQPRSNIPSYLELWLAKRSCLAKILLSLLGYIICVLKVYLEKCEELFQRTRASEQGLTYTPG